MAIEKPARNTLSVYLILRCDTAEVPTESALSIPHSARARLAVYSA